MQTKSYGANLFAFSQKEVHKSLGVDENRAGATVAPLMEKAAILALDWPEQWQVSLAIAIQMIVSRRKYETEHPPRVDGLGVRSGCSDLSFSRPTART